MIVLLLSLATLLIYLFVERLRVDRWRRRIPQVIAVTGTRGKSSVTRMLASALRADGRKVLAKTTGSSPRFLWPDGSETELRRRGPATILEQKALLENAARNDVDYVVAETMSIHPDNHVVESHQLLKPDIVVVTNTWPDHVSAQGTTEVDVAETLALDIPEHATAIISSFCDPSFFEAHAAGADQRLVVVKEEVSKSIRERIPTLDRHEHPENVDIVCGIANHIGIADVTISEGLKTFTRDPGSLSLHKLRTGDPEKTLIAANAFAANDPLSTRSAMDRVIDALPQSTPIVGLLCLRADRADRTQQWVDALADGWSGNFERLYVAGGHSVAVARKLKGARVLKERSSESLLARIANDVEDETAVFGFGNFGGLGQRLVEHWNSFGEKHGL